MSFISVNASEQPIKAVTIYSSNRAEVVRTFAVKLEVGQNEIAVTSLPSCIDHEGTRITGLGDAVLFDVACGLDDDDDSTNSPGSDEKELLLSKTALENEKQVYERKADILMSYGRSLTSESAMPATVTAFLSDFQSQCSEIAACVAELDAKISEVDEAIEKRKRESRKKRNRSQTKGRVTAVIMAKRASDVEITLTYIIIKGVSWTPSYDLRASTDGGRPPRAVSLHYRASLVQDTGEDWKNISLTLSTAAPGTFANVPKLHTVRVAPWQSFARPGGLFGQQNNIQHTSNGPGQFGPKPDNGRVFGGFGGGVAAPSQQQTVHFGSGGLFGAQTAAQQPNQTACATSSVPHNVFSNPQQAAQPLPTDDSWSVVANVDGGEDDPSQQTPPEPEGVWAESGTTVTDSAVSSSFHIDGLCSIPSGKTPHKVTIAVLSFDALVQYVAVPRAKAAAFLQCHVSNTSEYRLLSGPVHVYLDNMHVSKTSISDVNPEEKFKCTLGADPALRITYVRKPRSITTTSTAFAAQSTCSTYHVSTTLRNTHAFAIKDVILGDVVPLSPDTQGITGLTALQSIRVVLKEPRGLSEARPPTLVDVENRSATAATGKLSTVKARWTGTNGDKEGKYEWVASVGAGEEVKMEAIIEVHSPSHFNWHLVQEL